MAMTAPSRLDSDPAPAPRALLVENIHPDAEAALNGLGAVAVERLPGAPERATLARAIAGVELLGIRSRTQVDAALLGAAPELLAVGCFCIGTNQVDLEAAAARGIPVFNAPFANTRSVAELTLAGVVMLLRGVPRRMQAIRRGEWLKSAAGAHEVRAKKLGIVGYGNIGAQLSVLASGLGMHVYFYDHQPKLAHGNARVVASLAELLELVDAVTLHVPSTPKTRLMIGAQELARMKPGAVLINHARGDLVDVEALVAALDSGHLAGAAVDVFPREPERAGDLFESPLTRFDNVLLTPHIGGSTVEAQAAIGRDAAIKLARYVWEGATTHAVNFPEVEAGPIERGQVRVACVHENAPGFLSRFNETLGDAGKNVAAQHLETLGAIGYAVADLDGGLPAPLRDAISRLEGAIRTRVLRAPEER
jgi:D-3-phosphoglycerate dehydrogenase